MYILYLIGIVIAVYLLIDIAEYLSNKIRRR